MASELKFEFVSKHFEAVVETEYWAATSSIMMRPDVNSLQLNLPPVTYNGLVRYPEISRYPGRKIGRSFFIAAGHLIEGQGTAGQVESLKCRFGEDALLGALDLDHPLQPDEIMRGVDLSRTGVQPLLAQIVAELRYPQLGHAAIMEALMLQAIIELVRYLRKDATANERGRLTTAQLARVRERIRCTTLPPPTVSELATMTGFGERHLLRLFNETAGRSISSEIQAETVARARRLLIDGQLRLKEIAYLLGFSASSSFSRAFRKATKMTPLGYRNAFRGGERTIEESHG